MRKIKAVLAAALAAGMLTGCAGSGEAFEPESSSIYISGEGKLSTATIDTFEQKDYYKEEGLRAFAEEKVSEFNQEYGQEAVTLTSCRLEGGRAELVFEYGSPQAMVDFTAASQDMENQVNSISFGTVTELADQIMGYEGSWLKGADKKTVSVEEIAKKGDYQVAVIDSAQPVTIHTEKEIRFVSDNSVLEGSNKVRTSEGINYIIFK